jgi:hypothetical protein
MVNFKKELITPAYAKELLEKNTCNRRLKLANILKYAKDIANGQWRETGEAIKFSKTNVLLDGQHRLLAVIKANVPTYFHIAFGLEDSTLPFLDTGSSRSAADVFKIKGIKYSNKIPSIIAFYNLLSDGKFNRLQKNYKANNNELLEQYELEANYWEVIARQSDNYYTAFSKALSPSHIGGFSAFFYELNETKGLAFMYQLCTGLSIDNNVVALLRNKLYSDKIAVRKMPLNLKIALVIKTWNFFVSNQTVKFLKFDMEREEYPVAISK